MIFSTAYNTFRQVYSLLQLYYISVRYSSIWFSSSSVVALVGAVWGKRSSCHVIPSPIISATGTNAEQCSVKIDCNRQIDIGNSRITYTWRGGRSRSILDTIWVWSIVERSSGFGMNRLHHILTLYGELLFKKKDKLEEPSPKKVFFCFCPRQYY